MRICAYCVHNIESGSRFRIEDEDMRRATMNDRRMHIVRTGEEIAVVPETPLGFAVGDSMNTANRVVVKPGVTETLGSLWLVNTTATTI